jgi:hypothetical protein
MISLLIAHANRSSVCDTALDLFQIGPSLSSMLTIGQRPRRVTPRTAGIYRLHGKRRHHCSNAKQLSHISTLKIWNCTCFYSRPIFPVSAVPSLTVSTTLTHGTLFASFAAERRQNSADLVRLSYESGQKMPIRLCPSRLIDHYTITPVDTVRDFGVSLNSP